LSSIFERIDHELRTQYRLGYYPTPRGPADTYRHIEVKVAPTATTQASTASGDSPAQPTAYSVRHRKSYYTGSP